MLPSGNGRIIVSLSGGGYRAALFHAGVLRTLHELGALRPRDETNRRRVLVNSVSGGSIPALVWDRFLRSEQYWARNKSEVAPERIILDLVAASPVGFGVLSHHFTGVSKGAQQNWRKQLQKWWENIHLIPKTFLREDISPLVRPGFRQLLPTFLVQTLDYTNGRIFAFHEGDFFETDNEFFKEGEAKNILVGGRHPIDAIVAATAFPVFFPRLSIGNAELFDSGLIDNIGLFNFKPLTDISSSEKLTENDMWFISDAGSLLSSQVKHRFSKAEIVQRKLTAADKLFRYTGDLAQPVMNSMIMNLVEAAYKTKVLGVRMVPSSQHLWHSGPTIKSLEDAANLKTTLERVQRGDAIALISAGMQRTSEAFHASEQVGKSLRSLIKDLASTN